VNANGLLGVAQALNQPLKLTGSSKEFDASMHS
jgi:hypothetical protein